jgi:UDP-N-acetylmuramyl pentapeptide synthase
MELGMNHAGEISTLVAIAEPDVRVWINVGDAHLGFFASADAIADAKAEILERAVASTLLVCNADDPLVMARVSTFPGRLVTFGLAADATVRAINVEDRGVEGMRARVVTPEGEREIETPLLGRGNLANVLAATVVALEFDMALDDIAALAPSHIIISVGAGMPPGAVTYIENSDQAAARVAGALAPGDLVLVKGSRGIRTDVVVDRIVAEFA